MKYRGRLWLAGLMAVLGVNLVIGYQVFSREAERTGDKEAFEKIGVMMRVLHLIRKDYVDGEKVDYENLIYGALEGMVQSLDPYSGFMRPADYSSMMESTEGEFGGLGIIVTVRDEVLTIVAPIEDTPGARAGLQAGDQIIRIEGESTEGLQIGDATRKLKGTPGTAVNITIHRPATGETMDVSIERAMIPLNSVKDARVLPDSKFGYLRITQFNEPTAKKFGETLAELHEQGIEGLVIDLRNNPGGLLESAVDLCSFFLDEDVLVVSTEGRRPSQKRAFKATRTEKYPDLPVAVLINGGSASAAEIVAGCLGDWDRAVVVGVQSFGKGSVQHIIELPDRSALRLTTAMYYTPARQVIHNQGIAPDVEVKIDDAEFRALLEAQRRIPGVDGATDPVVDRQLEKAIEILGDYETFLAAAASADNKTGSDAGENPDSDDAGENPDAGEDDGAGQGETENGGEEP